MMVEMLIWVFVALVNVALLGQYAGLETGIYVLNKIRVELRAEAGQRTAKTLRHLLHRPNRLLAMLLIGTNIHTYVVTFAITAIFILAGKGELAEWYTLAVSTPLIFVFCESVPKNVYRRIAETVVYRLSGFLKWADRLFMVTGMTPLVWAFSTVLLKLLGQKSQSTVLHLGHEGIAAVLAEGHAAGALTGNQASMASRVMNLKRVHLTTVMQPAESIASVPVDISREALLATLAEHDYTRLPMLNTDGTVAGVIDVYDVLGDDRQCAPAELMISPLTLPDNMVITQALYTLQRARRSMAIVTDPRSGKLAGLVTIKDLVEEIVGELEEW